MLVIHLVELVAGNRFVQMRKLEGDRAAWSEENLQSCHEVVEVGNLREDIVAKKQIWDFALRDELARRVAAKKSHERSHAALFRGLGDIRSGFDAEGRNAPFDEILEEVPVIAGHLDHTTYAREGELVDHLIDVPAAVVQPR